MAKINNSTVVQKLIDDLELYPGKDIIPSEIADKILPVYNLNASATVEVTPKISNIVRSTYQSTAGTTTIYTVPATGEFYLTNINLSLNSSAAIAGYGKIELYIGGAQQVITQLYTGSASGGTEAISMTLTSPLLVDAATDIEVTTSNSNIDAIATVVGYTE